MKKLPQGEKLLEACQKAGISLHQSATQYAHVDSILQERLLAYRREQRDSRLWAVALISAIASVVSAVTAIVAVSRAS